MIWTFTARTMPTAYIDGFRGSERFFESKRQAVLSSVLRKGATAVDCIADEWVGGCRAKFTTSCGQHCTTCLLGGWLKCGSWAWIKGL
jgi:hypothetical protein